MQRNYTLYMIIFNDRECLVYAISDSLPILALASGCNVTGCVTRFVFAIDITAEYN